MKKIVMILLLLGTCSLAFAQKTTSKTDKSKTTTKEVKKSTGVNKNGSPDMRLKANKEAKKAAEEKAKQEEEAKKAAAEKAKQEKEAKKVAEEKAKKEEDAKKTAAEKTKKESEAKAKSTAKTSIQKANVANTPDKIVGKDSKGRTIYEGPRGGRYYINASGTKEYITKDKGN
ncbi:MAG TPA: hypothetical protein VHD35_03285 [Chitinophagaceae bacterium]|nr:hypothetical protein [Chitinophagaceae bacterium]